MDRIELILRTWLYLISNPGNNNATQLFRPVDLIGRKMPSEPKSISHTNSCCLECISGPLAALQIHGHLYTAKCYVGSRGTVVIFCVQTCPAAVYLAQISHTHAHRLSITRLCFLSDPKGALVRNKPALGRADIRSSPSDITPAAIRVECVSDT